MKKKGGIGVPLKTLTLGGFRQMSVPGFAAMLHDDVLLLESILASFLFNDTTKKSKIQDSSTRERAKTDAALFIPHRSRGERSFYPAGAFLRTTKPGSGVVGREG